MSLGSLINAPPPAGCRSRKHSSVAGGAEDVLAGRELSFHSRNAHVPSGMQNHPSLSVDWPSQRVRNPFYWCLRCASPPAPGGHADLIESKPERLLLLARAHKHKPQCGMAETILYGSHLHSVIRRFHCHVNTEKRSGQ